MTKKNKKDIDPEVLDAAMDIVRGMSYEEIQELLKSNGLYKVILKMDEENNGIHKESSSTDGI
jgi:beta-lactam-binding protein with PASTA domain